MDITRDRSDSEETAPRTFYVLVVVLSTYFLPLGPLGRERKLVRVHVDNA